MNYTIANQQIEITVKDEGAELISLILLETGEEYMWEGNPAYWNRTSPILFPFIGGLHNGRYTYEGQEYVMEKHGFLRDVTFTVDRVLEEEIWFVTSANEETRACYPFAFRLEIGYCLTGRSVQVIWNIHNEGERPMEYSIGGHPAFRCPRYEGECRTEYGVSFFGKGSLEQTKISKNGLAMDTPCELLLEGGIMPLREGIFHQDAVVVEGNQVSKIALVDGKKEVYLTMEYDAPVIAIWSKAETEAQFICFEPWYGLCDVEGMHVPLEQRKWNNHLEPYGMDQKGYTITI